MQLIIASLLLLPSPPTASATRPEAKISIANPKSHVNDRLVVTVFESAQEGPTKYIWEPVKVGMQPPADEKAGVLVWYMAFRIPGRPAFLLLKHVAGYEDDNVYPSIRGTDGKTVTLQTDGIPANNGLDIYLSKDGKCIHFQSDSHYAESADFWAKEYYDTGTGKRIDASSTHIITNIKDYVRIDSPK